MKRSIVRAVRRVEEKLTPTEKTSLEPGLQESLDRAMILKSVTEKMLSKVELITGHKKANSEPILEQLGNQMITAGNELGSNNPYGQALITVGQYERNLGKSQRVFYNICIDEYLVPMRMFIEGDMKQLMREISALEKKRLDLDVAKKKQSKSDPNNISATVLRDVTFAQAEFDRQKEVVELVVNRVLADEDRYVERLKKFVEIQYHYYDKCFDMIHHLDEELSTLPSR